MSGNTTKIQQGAVETVASFEMSDAKQMPVNAMANYTVMLINMTDLLIDRGCYNYRPGQPNEFFQISPPVGRTCSDNYETCHNQQKWLPVWNCQCSDPPFSLTLVNAEGRGATFNITPSCQYSGGSIGLS